MKGFLMKYTTIVFDCDGTLLDTITDLMNAVNHALGLHNHPLRSVNQVKSALGNGVTHLVRHSLLPHTAEDVVSTVLADFKDYYNNHLQDNTAPYEGILPLLDTLIEENYKIAIVSNKIQAAITPLNKNYFGDRIPVAIGERPNLQRKPAPHMVWEALKEIGSTAKESIYVGDSEVDIETAKNSGLLCIGVTWGFRTEELHKTLGVVHIAREPKDILSIIRKLNQ